MRLKKLELYGFKSFPQRTEIVFNEGITGIVGPNGSGKSNIGDAVRWVLGEQSAKTLRGSSMSDVIFNGTQKRRPQSYCEVSLTFDNEDHTLKGMDYSEITVTRRVYRSGEGEYYLNRSACRLKDIIDLFRDTGIGREGYSIIGQGRIDEILSRKSEDRRQVFEEAAGIVRHKTRKEDADKRLARTLENAARVDDILEELKRQLGPLERQSRDARTYLELSAELKILDLNLFLLKSDRFTARLNELDTELMNLTTVLADQETALNEKTVKRDEDQTAIDDLEMKITAGRSALLNAADDLHQAENEQTQLQARRAARAENRGRLEAEQEEADLRLRQLDELQNSSDEDIEAQEQLTAHCEQYLEEARTASYAAQLREQEAERALDDHKTAILDAMDRLSAVKNDRTRLETMRSQMAARLEELKSGAEGMVTEEKRLTELVASAEALLQEEERVCQERRDALNDVQERLRAGENGLNAFRTECEQFASQMQDKQTRWKLLSDMAREMDGYNQAVRRAIQYGKQTGLRGVKGALAQLIQVPQRYEVALDMALGAAKENIVTDTEETAKQMIDYLRSNRLGRATFLPMSAVRSHTLYDKERKVLSMPGCIGVASELITCAPEYRGIVENLLGRTVIADNLDHGIAIMRAGGHSFRLVTLEGDVMHSGGSMTGGSAQSRMVNLLSREREVKELADQLREGKTRFDAMKEQLKQKQEDLISLRSASQTALNDLHQQEIAVTRESEHSAAAHRMLDEHRTRMDETQEAMEQLTEAVSDLDGQLSGLEERHDNQQDDQAAMEQKTQELQDALYKARQDAQAASDSVMTRTLQLNDARHTLEAMKRDAGRRAQDRELILESSRQRAERLAAMAEQEAADEEAAAAMTLHIDELRRVMDGRSQTVTALETRRNAFQADLRQVLQDMEHLHESITRDSDRKHRAEMSRSRTDTELRSLQDRIWNTWELTYAGAEEFRQTEGFVPSDAEKQASSLNARIRALGHVNVNAVEEYTACKERFDELTLQQEDLRKAEKDLRDLIDQLVTQMKQDFTASFSKLQVYFSETFVKLFGGGHAELKLADPSDPLNCGIEINAQPPGKKLQLLSLLSGGERALCAIAILFAMLKLKPTPFCILDEIEAALDDANIGYYADYLKEFSVDTQFIVVTHRKGTMERCNSLYGVAMEEQGVSRMVSVSLQDYHEDVANN